MKEELIHRWLDGAADDKEMSELASAIDDDGFAYMLLESELAFDHRPPLRIVIPSTARRGLRRMTVILSGAAAVLLIGIITLMVFHEPPENEKIPWYIAEIERSGSDFPIAPFVIPSGAERGGTLSDGQKGGADGAPGGFGAPPDEGGGGAPKDPHLEKAFKVFARQFTFVVRFPDGLPSEFRLQRAKRIMPSAGGAAAETALLIYASGEKKIVILESLSETTSRGLPETYRRYERTVGNLRITYLGIGFDAPSWETLINQIKF